MCVGGGGGGGEQTRDVWGVSKHGREGGGGVSKHGMCGG